MYGVERSLVALTMDVGTTEGRTMLAVNGRVGIDGMGVVMFVVGSVMLFGRSHAVCIKH